MNNLLGLGAIASTISLDGASITTSGGQDYSGPVTVDHDSALVGASVTFESSLEGGHAACPVSAGTLSVPSVVGGGTPLADLSIHVTGGNLTVGRDPLERGGGTDIG